MGKKNRKRLSAILDDEPKAPGTVVEEKKVDVPKTERKTLKDALKKDQADFVEFLAQEDPDMLEQMEVGVWFIVLMNLCQLEYNFPYLQIRVVILNYLAVIVMKILTKKSWIRFWMRD